VRVSYYLRDEPYPGNERLVKPVRSDYVEFRLDPNGASPTAAAPAKKESPAAAAATAAPSAVASALEAAGATVKRDGSRIVGASFGKATNLEAVLPLLPQLRDVEELALETPP
jgi:hypothetical protein